MTVSSSWPPDGTNQSPRKSTSTPPRVNDQVAPGSLPPTLFRLPNLKPTPAVPARELGPLVPDSPAASLPPPVVDATTRDNQPTATTERHEDLTPPIPPRDVPAGRSWMELAQQHGVVVVLLLIVITMAVRGGRRSEDSRPHPAAITASTERPNIDDGALDNALDKAPIDIGVAVKGVVERTNVAELQAPLATSTPNQLELELNPAEFAAAVAASSPKPSINMISQRDQNHFETDSNPLSSPPSLQTLADPLDNAPPLVDEPQMAGDGEAGQVNLPSPVLTKTPAGIGDWSQYLPEIPSPHSH